MKSFYSINILQFLVTIFTPLILLIVLTALNKVLAKLINPKSAQFVRSNTKGKETYEFGTHSIGTLKSISNNQFIILAILFLIFDIELIFLIP